VKQYSTPRAPGALGRMYTEAAEAEPSIKQCQVSSSRASLEQRAYYRASANNHRRLSLRQRSKGRASSAKGYAESTARVRRESRRARCRLFPRQVSRVSSPDISRAVASPPDISRLSPLGRHCDARHASGLCPDKTYSANKANSANTRHK
jgi:hypothetical protein